MITRANPGKRSGFTLLELVAAIALFSVGMGVLTLSLGTLLRLRAQEDSHDDQISQLHETALQFRKDVHGSLSFPKDWGGFQSSETVIIMEQPGAKAVVWTMDDKGLNRAEITTGKAAKSTPMLTSLRQARGAFTQEANLARLEIRDLPRKKAEHRTRLVVEARKPTNLEAKP